VGNVIVSTPEATLPGFLQMPVVHRGTVVFAHGSGSSRLSPRNQAVAGVLEGEGFATLLFDLLTPEEALDRRNVFDIELLGRRLEDATSWLRSELTEEKPLGYFGASTGAAAALLAAADLGESVLAVVSRGGRPDLAGAALPRVMAPTLLIVGSRDTDVLELNRRALGLMRANARLEVIEGATHLFEEEGTLERVADLASAWFRAHLSGGVSSS